jgi:hypothetical protein
MQPKPKPKPLTLDMLKKACRHWLRCIRDARRSHSHGDWRRARECERRIENLLDRDDNQRKLFQEGID